MKSCLSFDPNQRPSACDILNHIFFTSVNFEKFSYFPYNILFLTKNRLMEQFLVEQSQMIIYKLSTFYTSNPRLRNILIYNVDMLTKMKACTNLITLSNYFNFNNELYIAYNNYNGGNLENYLNLKGILSSKNACLICKNIAECLVFLHNRNIIHRNIYVNNIFVNLNNFYPNDIESAVLGDFGFLRSLYTNFNEDILIKEKNLLEIANTDIDILAFGQTIQYMLKYVKEKNNCVNELLQLANKCANPASGQIKMISILKILKGIN